MAAVRARVALTGGIACGKSLLSRFLNELGVETLDADDIVHELIPDAEERRRIAAEVFADPAKRRALEAKLHPVVGRRIDEWLSASAAGLRVAVVPLLFEAHWERNYDIICCVASSRETQVERMTAMRGMTESEAEARLAAQMDVEEKARFSHYVIRNDGTVDQLKGQATAFVSWLEKRVKEKTQKTI